MVHKKTGALALMAALLMTGSAFAQQRVVTWNADYDPIPLAAGAALGPVFPHVTAGPEHLSAPVAAQHRAGGNENRRQVRAARAARRCGHHRARRGVAVVAESMAYWMTSSGLSVHTALI